MTEEERLKKRLEDQQKLLDQERIWQKKKKQKPNIRMDQDKPDRLDSYPFWCDLCQEDFNAPCYKTRNRIHGEWISIYRAKCPVCETDCIRHVTHRDEDPYYYKSTRLRIKRNQYAHEILQPGYYGYKTHYGEPFEEFNRIMEEKEEEEIRKQLAQGLKKFV